MATVIIPSMMRQFTENRAAVVVDGESLRDVLSRLIEEYPELKERLFDEDGRVHSHISFFVDGVETPARHGLLWPVPPGAEVVIVPALSGG